MQPTTIIPRSVGERLAALRTELVDLACLLERRGRLDAADVAIAVSARVGELGEELAAAETGKPPAGSRKP